jgi:hypothetical protein
MKTVPPKKSYFDFETDQSSGENVVSFAVAQYANGEEKMFPGYTACQDFYSWLFIFSPKPSGANMHYGFKCRKVSVLRR